MESIAHKRFSGITVVAIAAITALANLTLVSRAHAASAGPHHSFLGGPWEIVIKTHLDGEGLRFPLTVPDETKPQKLDSILSIKDPPVEIKLEDYVPDLKWETNAVKHPDGGIAVKLLINSTNRKQDLWLSSNDPGKQSISSSIGGVTIRRLHNTKNAEKLMQGLTHSRAVGILSILPEDGGRRLEYVAKIGEMIRIPGTKYKVTIIEYLPHYSVDTETKKVVNQSQKPVNPAVKVAINDGNKTFERWLWTKFPATPHKEKKLPLQLRFADFDLRGTKGKYILAVASGTQPWLLMSKKGDKRIERAVLGSSYPFADKEYSLSIEKIIDGAIVKTDWANGSQRLLRPAVIATIMQNGTSRQAVLELKKPIHHKIESGMLVLLYRRTQASLR
ncbi:MAG: hypothetical protein ACYSUX_01365 [Planctomycetota bacterium]|jgi:hypothetical protein